MLVTTKRFSRPLTLSTAIVGLDSEVKALGELLSSVGWLDERRALLARHPDRDVSRKDRRTRYLPYNEILSLMVYDVGTREQRTVFSR